MDVLATGNEYSFNFSQLHPSYLLTLLSSRITIEITHIPDTKHDKFFRIFVRKLQNFFGNRYIYINSSFSSLLNASNSASSVSILPPGNSHKSPCNDPFGRFDISTSSILMSLHLDIIPITTFTYTKFGS